MPAYLQVLNHNVLVTIIKILLLNYSVVSDTSVTPQTVAHQAPHGISQARILEWVVISISRRSSQIKDWIQISCTGRWILYHWTTCEAHTIKMHALKGNAALNIKNPSSENKDEYTVTLMNIAGDLVNQNKIRLSQFF